MADVDLTLYSKIAKSARAELPTTWDALAKHADIGDVEFLQGKVELILLRLFDEVISDAVQQSLDGRVVDYAGKLVALELIGPGIDYWGKQVTSVAAAGRNENKSFNDRVTSLRNLQAILLTQTRLIAPTIQDLLPVITSPGVPANIPRVKAIAVALTPDPFDFPPQYGPRRTN